MSRLIDKLQKQTQTARQPMGFRSSRQVETTATILIIAGVTIDAAGSPIKSIKGADAVLLHAGNFQLTANALPKIVKPLRDVPWGIYLEDSGDTPEALVEAGCDFLVLSPASPVSAVPQDEKIGKILQVESSMDDRLLRAANDLPVDAVLAADTLGETGTLIWHHLMILRHLAVLIPKPLIVPVPAGISEAELKALWNAGIDGVLVEIDITKDENLKELHDIAVKLPPRSAPKRGKIDALLPHFGGEAAKPAPDEEEEDE